MEKEDPINSHSLALITLTATLGGFLFGFDTAVISGTVGLVAKQYQLRSLMEGWYVSSALLGCIAGVAISGKLGNRLGRKKVMFLSAILFALSATGCALSSGAFMLIVFRLTGGIGIGVASVICPMYISEIAPASIRGKLVTYYQLAITIGILAAYFSNSTLQAHSASGIAGTGAGLWELVFRQEVWRGMFAAGILPALFFFLMIFLIPESPRWLDMIKNKKNATDANDPDAGKPGALFRGSLKKPLFIGITLAALSQFSGINAIIYYGPSILEKAGFHLGDALGGQVTIGIVNVLSTFVAIYYIDKVGRKPLLIWGTGGAVVSLLTAAILFAAKITGGWLVLIPVILFIMCFAFSFGSVTWVILSEIFPTKVRSQAVAISTMSLWIANWVVGQFFPLLLHNTNASFTFLVFAAFSAYAFYLALTKIPETKGRSLEEIESFWK